MRARCRSGSPRLEKRDNQNKARSKRNGDWPSDFAPQHAASRYQSGGFGVARRWCFGSLPDRSLSSAARCRHGARLGDRYLHRGNKRKPDCRQRCSGSSVTPEGILEPCPARTVPSGNRAVARLWRAGRQLAHGSRGHPRLFQAQSICLRWSPHTVGHRFGCVLLHRTSRADIERAGGFHAGRAPRHRPDGGGCECADR
jgi:hypothetical protein